MGSKPIKVLLIEDNPDDTRQIQEMLAEARGTLFNLECANRLSAGLKRIVSGGMPVNVILLDLSLPDSQGIDTFTTLYAQAPSIPVVVLTGPDDKKLAIKAVQAGAQDHLVKGQIDGSQMVRSICYAIERQRRLIVELERYLRSMVESQIRFRHMIQKDADGIVIVDRNGMVQFVNPAAEALFGHKAEELLGELFGFPIVVGEVTEIDIIHKDGKSGVAEMRTVEIEWEGKSAYLASLRDITERKQAQQLREKLSQQLQAKVSELEAFSYGIAHDLKSPLLSIEGLSRLLRADIQSQKTEMVQEDIRLLESGVRKMQQFLNRTLEYSRAGYSVKPARNVSFGKLANEVVAEFAEQMRSIGATVSLAEKFPKVYMDRMRIKEVLTNLIQNSIDYRDKTVPLKIKIGYRLSKGEDIFFVRDNGTGIDTSDMEKVFALFYRGTTDGEGSGAGLAIVKRIIEAHGGRVWVQYQSERGTTICFTLPQRRGTNKGDNNGKD